MNHSQLLKPREAKAWYWFVSRFVLPVAVALTSVWTANLYLASPRPVYDSAQYVAMAYNMAKYGTSSMSEEDHAGVKPDFFREPGAAFVYALTMRVVLDLKRTTLSCLLDDKLLCSRELRRVLRANILIFALTVLLLYFGTLKLSGSAFAATCAAIILALNTALPSYVRVFSSELPAALLFAGHSLLLAIAVRRSPNGWAAAGAGIMLGLLILTKAIYYYWLLALALLLVGFLACRIVRPTKHALMTWSLILIPGLLMSGFWMGRNYLHFGHATLSDRSDAVLSIRSDYTTITWPQYIAGYFYFTPYVGPDLARRFFTKTDVDIFDVGSPGSLENVERKNILATRLEGRTVTADMYRGEIWRVLLDNWDKQLALIPLTIYRGMFIGGCCNFLANDLPPYYVKHPSPLETRLWPIVWRVEIVLTVILGLLFFAITFYAFLRRQLTMLALCAPALFHFAMHGFFTHFNPRFSLPLLPTLIGIAVLGSLPLVARPGRRHGQERFPDEGKPS